MSQVVEDSLEAGREAFRRNAWEEAFRLLSEADGSGRLAPEDLEMLGQAAWWVAKPDDSVHARERAHAAYLDAGKRSRAALMALVLSQDYLQRVSPSISAGWYRKAQRLLENEPESVEHGWGARFRSFRALEMEGRPDLAVEFARQALDIGMRFGDRDLQAVALMDQGRALVAQGRVREGQDLMDEAMVAAVGGELGPFMTGIVYCNMISTAEHLADYQRAGEWEEAARRWCERQSINGFPGICRVHRAAVMRLRGSWADAEAEARRASNELREHNMLRFVAEAFYEIGEIRLRMGDLASSEEAFRQAHELGRDPFPGLALVRLAEGNVQAAVAAMKRADAETPSDRLGRAKLLPAEVQIALAADDVSWASQAADEMDSIAEEYGTPALRAAAASVRGAVLLAADVPTEALRKFRQSWQLWGEVDCPYEAASARVGIGQAYVALGDQDAAMLEVGAARSAFERLGAVLDAKRATELLNKLSGDGKAKTRDRRTFMFTDIVKSTALVEAIGDESWEHLLNWHDETIRSLIRMYSGEEIDKAGDGFFVAFDAEKDAIECAVAIQLKLADHRRTHGFAPQVRIGLHATEATRTGQDYMGKGVHEAARIGALAEGGEILASGATLEQGVPFPVSDPRTVTLKGISEPVQVCAIDWR
ncbi:MAG: adenylate/guanylate cyclase domain-containing protein [Actinomycetota bacterium]|nr:adenylate/guanylate cyclase domain-containing protein [Actinomycetota bacterium]